MASANSCAILHYLKHSISQEETTISTGKIQNKSLTHYQVASYSHLILFSILKLKFFKYRNRPRDYKMGTL